MPEPRGSRHTPCHAGRFPERKLETICDLKYATGFDIKKDMVDYALSEAGAFEKRASSKTPITHLTERASSKAPCQQNLYGHGHVQACDCAEAYMYVRRQERYVTAEDDTEE